MLKKIFSIFSQKVPENPKPKHYYKQLLTDDYIQTLIKYGDFIDGRNGGYLLGNSHDEGGIISLYQYPEGFRIFGEVEGHEYIINRDSAEIHRARIGEINNYDRDFANFQEYELPENVKIIDARMKNNRYKYLLLDIRGGFAIINRHSTKVHLNEIEIINNSK